MRTSVRNRESQSVDPNVFETANAGFAQVMYEEYLRDPAAVGEEWRELFERGVVGLNGAGAEAGKAGKAGRAGQARRAGQGKKAEAKFAVRGSWGTGTPSRLATGTIPRTALAAT
jgi:2-oxoglutarate dehydrogenase complex dehydrogenase (E1) component-like enzyme